MDNGSGDAGTGEAADSAALQGVDFCRAYPDQMKPSRLLRPVVAVRLAEMDGTSDAVGEESRAGQIALCFDLYAPRLPVLGLCNRCSPAFAARCWIGGCVRCRPAPQADTHTGCLHLRATLTYREDLEDGDGEYERTE